MSRLSTVIEERLDDVEARHPPPRNLAEEFADLELTPTELARQLSGQNKRQSRECARKHGPEDRSGHGPLGEKRRPATG
jgi:hypothetical protein